MRKYHIFLVLIHFALMPKAFGQGIEVTATADWDDWVLFQCDNAFSWNSGYAGISVSCGDYAISDNDDDNYDAYVEYFNPDPSVNNYVVFPNGQQGLKINEGQSLSLRGRADTSSDEGQFRIVRFYLDQNGQKQTEVVHFNTTNYASLYLVEDFVFTEPGKYLIFSYSKYKRIGSDVHRRAIGWVYVLPNSPTCTGSCDFSACYVGPDAQCPEENCECDDTNTTPDGSTDYYWSGTENPVGGDLLYHAEIKTEPIPNTSFYWYKSAGEFDSDFIPKKNNPNPATDGQNTSHTIDYRLTGPLTSESYQETIYGRAARNGMLSDETTVNIVRNLVPEPRYEVDKDCFGFSAKFINTSVVLGNPDYVFYTWHFGDGNKIVESHDSSPQDATDNDPIDYEYINAGEYSPVLQITYKYNEVCGERYVFAKPENQRPFNLEALTVESRVPSYDTYTMTDVLDVSASSFQDSWIMALGGEDAVRNLNPFANGQRGLWRGEGSFALIKDRKGPQDDNRHYGTPIDMKEDGTFDLEAFNWQVHNGPAWVKASAITEYSPYGSAIENKDALNRYTTGLFGYNGELSTAVGANMKHREMAFTSFEEDVTAQANSGNLNIFNSAALRLMKIPVLGGRNEVAILGYPFLEIDKLRNLNAIEGGITLRGTNIESGGSFTIGDVAISCKFRDSRSANQAIVRFSGAGLGVLGSVWKGELNYYTAIGGNTNIENTVAEIAETGEVIDVKAHTGKRYLRVYNDFSQAQNFLELEDGKKYIISAWVQVNTNQPFDATYKSASNVTNKLGIAVLSQSGTSVAMMQPAGTIIEGWQRIEGSFTFQEEMGRISIRFQTGEYTEAYFDDLRLFPSLGNMQSYVYDPANYRLLATLDNNNYATLYSYDSEGNLYLVKKETIEGIKTIQESLSHQKGSDDNN